MNTCLNANEVAQVFGALTGGAAAGEAALLCKSAAESICGRLSDGADIAKNHAALCYAAGCLAAYRFRIKNELDPQPEFKAGDISVKPSGTSLEAAKQLLDDALSGIRHLFKRGEGVACSVGGYYFDQKADF